MNLPDGYLLQQGKYRLTQVIGQGGFGITYKGVWFTEVKGSLGAMRTEVPVCIKEYFFKDYCVRDSQSYNVRVHSDTGKLLFHKFKEKLIKEAKILSEVHHPYIVNVLEVFEENNTAYIAMEYISGNSLKDKLAKEGKLSENEVLHYVHQIGEALQFVHQKNILHLDIKPSNILIDKDNNARLIDFGVSKRYDVGEQETSTTMLTLSKGFASIEQYDSEGIQSFSPCPDVYSLGATMYNLLTGKIPVESILRATRPLLNPRALNPNISAKTEEVILKAMEIIPSNRYQSIAEMMDALDFPEPIALPKSEDDSLSADEKRKKEEDALSEADEDDETIVNKPDEVTILNQPERKETEENHPKKKPLSKLAFISGIIVLLLVGGAGWYWLNRTEKDIVTLSDLNETVVQDENKPSEEIVPQPEEKNPVQPEKNTIFEEKDADKRKETSAQNEQKKPDISVPEKQASNAMANNHMREDEKNSAQQVSKRIEEKETISASSATLIDTQYAKWLNLGKDKMSKNDFVGAKSDLTNAKNMKVTEEVVRLLVVCEEKISEEKIVDKKAQYIEMMSFGSYTIVRKKSNNRYGAIDEEGDERIPCKYLSVGRADNGRAFEREDNLFDIYGSDGNILIQGATYY